MPMVERTPGMFAKVIVSALLLGVPTVAMWFAAPPTPEYRMVDEVVDRLDDFEGKTLRLHGWVTPGSIASRQGCARSDEIQFFVQKGVRQLAVRYNGLRPDTFKDQSQV